MTTDNRWPPHFPAACPPTGAEPAAGVFYRFGKRPFPREELFESKMERAPDGPHEDACLACGLSMYDHQDTLTDLQRYGGGFRNKVVVRIDLNGAPGRYRQTRGPGHHTWWLPFGVDRALLLSRCAVV